MIWMRHETTACVRVNTYTHERRVYVFIHIHAAVGRLCLLEDLDASRNKISDLPVEMGVMARLKRLDIAHNALVRVLQCVAMCCSVLQCAAVCCSVLQCAAVCCSVCLK